MNRGRTRQTVFHGDDYYHAFLVSLEEASNRFNLEVIAYCLMKNHYHLFVKTPLGNLDRCMRHINGTYTQRYNRLRKTDGSLFRGRYKAILVETDEYGLQLSRYIHRNPLDVKKPQRMQLSDHKWSSYPAYVNEVKSPVWLKQEMIYDLLGSKRRYASYKRYVEAGIDEEIKEFYGKGNQAAILGSDDFVKNIIEENKDKSPSIHKLQGNYPSIEKIIEATAQAFEVRSSSIRTSARGRGSKNIPRWVALYLCRELSQARLYEIADAFGITHISGVSMAVYKLQPILEQDGSVKALLKLLEDNLTP
jgi:REP element-mobilizing transposase RayT